ncbi:MAG: hypothetical protein KDF58_01790 [Alphaproteobacteria bacterium]|nr:hypothetical protein [Alphaproteobacteria bacterium]
MVDIASASAASSQIQIDAGHSSSQENAAIEVKAQEEKIENSVNGRSTVESGTEPGVGEKIDIRA